MREDKNAILTYKKVLELSKRKKYQNIIDIGCGNTDLLKNIKKSNVFDKNYKIKYVGVGFDVKNENEDIEIISKLDFNKNNWSKKIIHKYDLILILDVIEHLENPFLFLKNIKNISNTNSNILISIPNIQSYRSRLRFLLTGRPSSFFPKEFLRSSKRDFDFHIWLPSIDLIKYFLRCNQLKLKKIHYIYGNNIFTSHTLLLEIKFS